MHTAGNCGKTLWKIASSAASIFDKDYANTRRIMAQDADYLEVVLLTITRSTHGTRRTWQLDDKK
jgi:hypothetical protein